MDSAFGTSIRRGGRLEFGVILDVLIESIEHGIPGNPESGFSGRGSDRAPLVLIGCELTTGFEKLFRIVKGHEIAIFFVYDVFVGGGVVVCEDGKAASHRFGNDITKRLSGAGKEKGIGTGIVTGKVLATTHSCKMDVGIVGFKFFAFGAITNDDQFEGGEDRPHFEPSIDGQRDVFFSGNSAHINSDRGFGRSTP